MKAQGTPTSPRCVEVSVCCVCSKDCHLPPVGTDVIVISWLSPTFVAAKTRLEFPFCSMALAHFPSVVNVFYPYGRLLLPAVCKDCLQCFSLSSCVSHFPGIGQCWIPTRQSSGWRNKLPWGEGGLSVGRQSFSTLASLALAAFSVMRPWRLALIMKSLLCVLSLFMPHLPLSICVNESL